MLPYCRSCRTATPLRDQDRAAAQLSAYCTSAVVALHDRQSVVDRHDDVDADGIRDECPSTRQTHMNEGSNVTKLTHLFERCRKRSKSLHMPTNICKSKLFCDPRRYYMLLRYYMMLTRVEVFRFGTLLFYI